MMRVVDYSFSLNKFVMKIIGLYPSDKYPTLHKIYGFSLYVMAMIPPTVCGILRFIINQDLMSIDFYDFILVGMFFYTIKIFFFIKNSERIKNCIHYFDAFIYTMVKEKQLEIIEKCVNICRKISIVFFIGCVACVVGFFVQLANRGDSHRLPLNIWLPKFIKEDSKLYDVAYLILVLEVTYTGLTVGTTESLIGGLSYHAAAQVQVLKEKLQHLDEDVEEQLKIFKIRDEETKHKKIYQGITQCIQHYKIIINFVSEYQDCFSVIVFSQFTGSGVIIGITCYQASQMAMSDFNFIIMIIYLGVMFFQIFFYSYYGTLLIHESSTICTAIYLSRWYDYDLNSKKALMIFMERSKRPMVVRAGKLLDLSLETFTTVLKRSYSLLAVLKNF